MSEFHPGGGEPPHRSFTEAFLRGVTSAPPDALKYAISVALDVAKASGHDTHVAYEEARTFLDRYTSMGDALGPDAPFEASDHLEALHNIPGLADKVSQAWHSDMALHRLLTTPASSGPSFSPGSMGGFAGPKPGPGAEEAQSSDGTDLAAGDPLMEALRRAAFNAEADIRGMEPETGGPRQPRSDAPQPSADATPADPLAEAMPSSADSGNKRIKRGQMPDGYMRDYGFGAWSRSFLFTTAYLLRRGAGAVTYGLEEVQNSFDKLRASHNVKPADFGPQEPIRPRAPRDPGEAFKGNVAAYRSGREDVMRARERMKQAAFAGVKIAAMGVEMHRHPEMGPVLQRIRDAAMLHGLTPEQVMQMMQPGGKHADIGEAWARAGNDPEGKRIKEAFAGAVSDWRNKWELAAVDAHAAGFAESDVDALFTRNQNMVLTAVGSVPDIFGSEPGRLKRSMESAKKAAESIARLIARIFNRNHETGYSPA